MNVYSVVIDGKKITMLSRKELSVLELSRFLIEKFGKNRIGSLSKGLENERPIQKAVSKPQQDAAGFDE